ncbi:TPA: hypothetical protein DHT42_01565 [Candidatus Nomurabacteria bacterium]|nr:hypothetical protein [Candidatus Nomurabacteria bacterium]
MPELWNFIFFMFCSCFSIFFLVIIYLKVKYNPESYFFVKPLVWGLIKIFLFFSIFAAFHKVACA